MRRQDIFGPEEHDVPTGMLTPPDARSARRSPLKRLRTMSQASADDVFLLPPRSRVSEEHTTAGPTSPRTTKDAVVSVDPNEYILAARASY